MARFARVTHAFTQAFLDIEIHSEKKEKRSSDGSSARNKYESSDVASAEA